jgi:hypothetical protein
VQNPPFYVINIKLYIHSIQSKVKMRIPTRKGFYTKMVNNDELQANVNCCRDEVNIVSHNLGNVERGQK